MKKGLSVIIFICAILTFLWFKDGYIMGAAEAVLPFYRLDRYLALTANAWTFHPGLGNMSGLTVASWPTYLSLGSLQNMGIPGYVLQAMTFLFVLLSGSLGIFFLMRELFPGISTKYHLFSALFYLFNPIVLVNVWNRFLMNFMFFYGLLPVAVLVFIKGIRAQNYSYAVLLPLVLIVYSFAFSSIAFLLLLWICLCLITIFYFLASSSWKERLFCLKYIFVTLILFILVHAWYLSQLLNYSAPENFESNIRSFHSQTNNLANLDSLSKKMGNISDLYRGFNWSFFNEIGPEWVRNYKSLPIQVVGFATTGVLLLAILKGRKDQGVLLSGFIFLAGIFLSKGANPPLGGIYRLIFENLVFLQVFRNPIEKFSFILSLGSSLLFGLGFYYLFKNGERRDSSRKSGKVFLIWGLFLLIIGIWAYPYFSGLIFTGKEPPNNDLNIGYKVKIPEYYSEANKFFEGKGNNFRVIGLPIGDEGITYLWEKGYQGADVPSALFSMPVIFFNTPVPFYYKLVQDLESNVLTKEVSSPLPGLEYFLNVRYLFVREDVDFGYRKLTDPKVIEKGLKSREDNGEIKKVEEFGKIKIWENNKWEDTTFYSANRLVATSEGNLVNLKQLQRGEVIYEGVSDFENTTSLPKISYKKINPAEYRVEISGAKEPFILVFSETYSPSWQGSIRGQEVKDHIRVNIYANGWIVNERGDFDMKIKFTPQSYLEAGKRISILSIGGGVAFLAWRKWRRGS